MTFHNLNDPVGFPSNNHNRNYYNNSGRGGGGTDDVVSIGTWVLILILTAIPVVNIISLFVMAFGIGNQNIKNYGKAALIIMGIGIVLAMLLGACSDF
ncbi:hypothetical protein [Proteiniborus sp. MB09-C3]|uniref:hypothetical protein n=1 Tax=Proteiniborus sp. MB09-C3 TaxID=3050072 RepID=UPI00255663A5|nr:hypothetical protein [Proteiniborus sp. MB09-C3]WIV13746.1 hypothetical protein QO263_08630 [Proteiniborus sp. MB09-C3]